MKYVKLTDFFNFIQIRLKWRDPNLGYQLLKKKKNQRNCKSKLKDSKNNDYTEIMNMQEPVVFSKGNRN